MPDATPQHFDAAWWQARGDVVGEARGRAAVCFVRGPQAVWALRHYCRGGWMSRLYDRYVWPGLERTRPWREWRLTAALHGHGLPVPKPVAAHVARARAFYRGDLITCRIESAEALADLLQQRALPSGDWHDIGAMLRRFHDAGVRHDDINARNVLRDAHGGFHLLDFDKAHIARAGAWRERNLARLRRSLEKFAARMPAFHFGAVAWRALEQGYGTPGRSGRDRLRLDHVATLLLAATLDPVPGALPEIAEDAERLHPSASAALRRSFAPVFL